MTPMEYVDRLAKAPLSQQPGRVWEYSVAVDVLGRVVEAASGATLGKFLETRVFEPLKMNDTGFSVPASKMTRLAQPFDKDPITGASIALIDVSKPPKNDSGGAGGVSTAADYLAFSQMLLGGGRLNGTRVLSRNTVALMTSDHLGQKILDAGTTPGELLLSSPGYTLRPRLCRPPRGGPRRRTWFGRRVHVGGVRRDVLLGGSEGGDRRGADDPGPRGAARVLPEAAQGSRLPGT